MLKKIEGKNDIIVLNIPLNIKELEELSKFFPKLFNNYLKLEGKRDFRTISPNSLGLGEILRTRTKGSSDDIGTLTYNNNIAEEIFKFVNKLKGTDEKDIDVSKSILESGNLGNGDNNYDKIGFPTNPNLEKIKNKLLP